MANEITVEDSIKDAQNLPFHVVAVPQNNISDILDTKLGKSSKPVNIKVRIKNKEETTGRHEIVSVPKLTSGPKKVRLVSSDQTIISFDLFMETENVIKAPKKPHHKLLQLFKPSVCFNNKTDDDIYAYVPGASNVAYRAKSASYVDDLKDDKLLEEKFVLKKNPSPMMTNTNTTLRTTTFLGKCKPGGCLDPPFGEDKYVYKPNAEKLTFDQYEFTNKIIIEDFTNKTEAADKPNNDMPHIPNKSSIEEIYSHSLITYPPALSSSKSCVQEELNRNKDVLSLPNSAKISINEFSDSYFMPPKKRKKHNSENQKREIITSNSYDKKSEKSHTSLFPMRTNQLPDEEREPIALCGNDKGNISDADLLFGRNMPYTEICNGNKENFIENKYLTSPGNISLIETESSFLYNDNTHNEVLDMQGQISKDKLAGPELHKSQSPIKSCQVKNENNNNIQRVAPDEKRKLEKSSLHTSHTYITESVNLLKNDRESLAEPSNLLLKQKIQNKEVLNLLQIDVQQSVPSITKNGQSMPLKESDHSQNCLQEKIKNKGAKDLPQNDLLLNITSRQKDVQLKQLTESENSQFALQEKTQNEEVANILQKDLQQTMSPFLKNGQSILLTESDNSQVFLEKERIKSEDKMKLSQNNFPTKLKETDILQFIIQEEKQNKGVISSFKIDLQQNMQPLQASALSVSLKENHSNYFLDDKFQNKGDINSIHKDSQEIKPQIPKNVQTIELTESDHSQFALQKTTQNGTFEDFLQKDLEQKNVQSVQLKHSDHSKSLQEKIESREALNLLQNDSPLNMSQLQRNGQSIQMKEFDHSQFTVQQKTPNEEEILQLNEVSTKSSTNKMENDPDDLLNENITYITKTKYNESNLDMSMLYSSKPAEKQIDYHTSVDEMPSDSLVTKVMSTKVLPENKTDVIAAPTDNLDVDVTKHVVQGLNKNVSIEKEVSGIKKDMSSTNILFEKEKVSKKETVSEEFLKSKPPLQSNYINVVESANKNSYNLGGTVIDIDTNLEYQKKIHSDHTIPKSYLNLKSKDLIENLRYEGDLVLPKDDITYRNKNSMMEIDLGFYTIENDKNEIFIKSFDTLEHPSNMNLNKMTIIKSLVRNSDDEIRIPINRDLDLTLQIKKSVDEGTISKKVVDDIKKPPTDKSKLNKDISLQETLEFLHEKLFPLENIIRDLKQEADDLTKQQAMLREIISNMKTESVKAISARTMCNCNKYLM